MDRDYVCCRQSQFNFTIKLILLLPKTRSRRKHFFIYSILLVHKKILYCSYIYCCYSYYTHIDHNGVQLIVEVNSFIPIIFL